MVRVASPENVLLNTVMCLSIGTPINNKFSICSKWKIIIFICPKIWANYNLIMVSLNIGTPDNYHFSFETNRKVVALGVPILKHFRVSLGCPNILALVALFVACFHYSEV